MRRLANTLDKIDDRELITIVLLCSTKIFVLISIPYCLFVVIIKLIKTKMRFGV